MLRHRHEMKVEFFSLSFMSIFMPNIDMVVHNIVKNILKIEHFRLIKPRQSIL